MKRVPTIAAVAVLAITLIVVSLVPAQANHTPAHTQRQLNRLENQVDKLQDQVADMRVDVRDLLIDVFGCTFVNTTTPTTFPDGTVGFPLFYDQFCLGAAAAGRPARVEAP